MTTVCGRSSTSQNNLLFLPPVLTDEVTIELQIVYVAVDRRSTFVVVTLVQF